MCLQGERDEGQFAGIPEAGKGGLLVGQAPAYDEADGLSLGTGTAACLGACAACLRDGLLLSVFRAVACLCNGRFSFAFVLPPRNFIEPARIFGKKALTDRIHAVDFSRDNPLAAVRMA